VAQNLTMIMERVAHNGTPDDFALWACRGEGRGCKRNRTRASAKHCDDCVPCSNMGETLGEVIDRLKRGDA